MTVAALQQNPDTSSANPYLASTFSSRCGYTASFCVSAPGTRIYSAVIGGTSLADLTQGYANKNGTSMAAPHAAGAAAVLMERFPYMNGAQIASVLRTTATDMGAPGIDALYGWGMINLDKGIRGPGMLVTEQDIPEEFRIAGGYGPSQFVVDLPGIGAVVDAGKPTQRLCNSLGCGLDLWSNDISGHGGLTKQGIGTLVLSGNNTYSGPTLVNQGRLAVNGSLQSTVAVNAGGVLGGNGRIGALVVNPGGVVAPGNSIGTLQVSSDVTFQPGSTYAVEVDTTGSDRLVSGGQVSWAVRTWPWTCRILVFRCKPSRRRAWWGVSSTFWTPRAACRAVSPTCSPTCCSSVAAWPIAATGCNWRCNAAPASPVLA